MSVDRIWIELEVDPADMAVNVRRAKLASSMFRKLGVKHEAFLWHEKRKAYVHNTGPDGGFHTLDDNGQWFNLAWLGKEAE